MFSRVRVTVAALALIGAVGFTTGVGAQQAVELTNNFKFNSGQGVQPVFEGWSKNPDGTFNMHFGYLNRNWVQHLSVPVGPNNSVEPGGTDRGQPAFFYPRMQRNLFTVVVPKDWGKKELIWTITANGKTEKAYGWLQAEWEIDPAGGAATGGQTDKELIGNKPPSITVTADSTVKAGQTLRMVGNYTDDGIPKPAPPRKPALGQETPPTLVSQLEAPVNLPDLAPPRREAGGGGPGGPRGPSVSWMVYRGPAAAEFQTRSTPVKDGKVENAVSFSVPGEYTLRVRASDRNLFFDREVKVTVTP
ncbi:MAG: hypothetical protein FJW27_06560 [Acidimicrobiia bacterium]|nr:hypothetical protein [Acidimicrobiia bacterium]